MNLIGELLNRQGKFNLSLFECGEGKKIPQQSLTILSGLLINEGYQLSSELRTGLSKLTNKGFASASSVLLKSIKDLSFSDRNYETLVIDFNKIDQTEAYLNLFTEDFIIRNYGVKSHNGTTIELDCECPLELSIWQVEQLYNFTSCPICQKTVSQLPLIKDPVTYKSFTSNIKTIELGTDDDVIEFCRTLVCSSIPLSFHERNLVLEGLSIYKEKVFLNCDIRIKETVTLISKYIIRNDFDVNLVFPFFNTATDVLRLAVALSGGDDSLKRRVGFRLSVRERKIICYLANKISDPIEDMKRYRGLWLSLSRTLRIKKYKRKFKCFYANIEILRERHTEIKTFNSRKECLLAEAKNGGSIVPFVRFASKRPGEAMRMIDVFLRHAHPSEHKEILDIISTKIMPGVNSLKLLHLRSHLISRDNPSLGRFIIPKLAGKSSAKLTFVEGDERLPISKELIDGFISELEIELIKRFSSLEPLGNVFIDSELNNRFLPLSNRNSSYSLDGYTRGSRISIEEKLSKIRFYLYWKGSCDLDLSLIFLDDDFSYINSIFYGDCCEKSEWARFSGDKQCAINGAAEMYDIDVASLKEKSIRYIVAFVNIYDEASAFDEVESIVGVMETSSNFDGSSFEPSLARNQMRLAGGSMSMIPFAFDIESQQYIWLDIDGAVAERYMNIMHGEVSANIQHSIAMALSMNQPTFYDILEMHCKARAKSFSSSRGGSEIDTVFDVGLTKDINKFIQDFLS